MDHLISLCGLVGAVLCVGMYAAVCFGKYEADKVPFFAVNGIGAGLILIGASHEFDIGDLGTVGQEFVWAAISFYGGWRTWQRERSAA